MLIWTVCTILSIKTFLNALHLRLYMFVGQFVYTYTTTVVLERKLKTVLIVGFDEVSETNFAQTFENFRRKLSITKNEIRFDYFCTMLYMYVGQFVYTYTTTVVLERKLKTVLIVGFNEVSYCRNHKMYA